jgi:hypothetical protein
MEQTFMPGTIDAVVADPHRALVAGRRDEVAGPPLAGYRTVNFW